MTVFTIEQTWNPNYRQILCTDGDFHGVPYVGFGAHTARRWKTRKGAERFAAERWNHPSNANRITGENKYTVEVVEWP